MRIDLIADQRALAQRGAQLIAQAAQDAIRQRGQFVFAVSGGAVPWVMFEALGKEDVKWDKVHLFQVDERVAPDDDPDRNLTHLRESLLDHAPFAADHVHPMPVMGTDLEAAARKYSNDLRQTAGADRVLDLVHLGLGPDGHTASLVPGDPVLEVSDRDVAITGVYQNRRRMTLTYPILNRAAQILWLVTGANKAEPLARLMAGDRSIPAGRIESSRAVLLADAAAAAKLPASM
jgi:6-phosphogluconolactonase